MRKQNTRAYRRCRHRLWSKCAESRVTPLCRRRYWMPRTCSSQSQRTRWPWACHWTILPRCLEVEPSDMSALENHQLNIALSLQLETLTSSALALYRSHRLYGAQKNKTTTITTTTTTRTIFRNVKWEKNAWSGLLVTDHYKIYNRFFLSENFVKIYPITFRVGLILLIWHTCWGSRIFLKHGLIYASLRPTYHFSMRCSFTVHDG